MEDKDIYITYGSRPIWQRILAAALLTASLYFVYLFVISYQSNVDKNVKGLASLFQVAIFCFAGAIGFSRVIDYQFNLKERSYRIIYNFGALQFGKSFSFKSIDYISVYFNAGAEVVEVNLWYNTNKHFTMSHFQDPKKALESGAIIAKKLKIELWDATNPRQGKWVV